MQKSAISIRNTSLYWSQPSSVVFSCKTGGLLDQNNTPLWAPDITCHFVHTKQRELHQKYWYQWVPSHICGFCMQNSDSWTQISSLYGSKTSPVVLCMQFIAISTRTISLTGSQPSSVVFACKTASFGPELHVSMGPRLHLSFCACKTAYLAPESLVSEGPSPHL